MHGCNACWVGLLPGKGSVGTDDEFGANRGVGVRAVGIQCLK